MAQLLGRDTVVRRIAAAVERARRAGGGTVVVCGPAGVGTSAAVDEAVRPMGSKVSRALGRLPGDATASVWWIDDAQRMSASDVKRLEAAAADSSLVLLLSGRAPLGDALAGVVRDAVRADPSCVVDVAPLASEDAVEVVADGMVREGRDGEWATRAMQVAAESGSRLRLLAAALGTDDGGVETSTAVRVAVDDLLSDVTPAAGRLLDTVAVGGPSARLAAVEAVWARVGGVSSAGFDETLAELTAAGLVAGEGHQVRVRVPLIGDAVVARLGAGRIAALRVAFADVLAGLEGVDPRETAAHVHAVADRLPRAFSTEVLRSAAERRLEASDSLGAIEDLTIAADLLEAAVEAGSAAERSAAFEVLLALGVASYNGGQLERAERAFRRAERFAADVPDARLAELELNKTYLRADRGQPSSLPAEHTDTDSSGGEDRRAVDVAVMRLFLVDRGEDAAELDAACAQLIAFDGVAATPAERGAAAVGRSIRASVAGDLALAAAEADRALRLAADSSVAVYGAIQRELIRLCTLQGDLAAALRHADGDSFALEGRLPRIVQASAIVHGASIALLQGDVVEAAARAERALATSRQAPVPRGIVRCAGWVAVVSAMRGDLARARSLIAEAGRLFPLEGNLRLSAIVQLARLQVALREAGPVPPSVDLRMERAEGPARLLLPLLLARVALDNADTEAAEDALAEFDRLDGSPIAAALAQRVRALMLIPTRRRREATDALDDSATALERLGFAGFAAETRLEWAELAAEGGDPSARSAVVGLVQYFDAQGLDDWADRARRLARTLGVRIGGRRGGAGELTRREAEVVELVVSGLSNAEVASRLYLSERTVETHLQHVYRRLGVDSRLALITKMGAASSAEVDGA